MKAFVLAAGYGKRLEPLTKAVPKPMVPVANKPIMQYNIELLKKYWIKDLCTNIHYFPEQLENYFGDGSAFGVNLKYSYEDQLLGTAGGVKRMTEIMEIKETFMVISSDVLTDINIGNMLNHHKKTKAMATIALIPVEDVTQFGVVVIDDKTRITAFQEKPTKEAAKSTLVNTGIYIFEPGILNYIPDGKSFDFGHNVFPKLVEDKAPFYGYKMIEYWNDVGGHEKLIQANADILQGRVRAEIHARRVGRATWMGKNTEIHKTAKFDGEIILGDNCVIGENVEIYGNVAIGDKCVIDDGTIINNSFIWSDTRIGKNSRLHKCIIGNWCMLGDGVTIEEGVIMGNRCSVKAGKKVSANTKVEPDKAL
jgi:NDP-sugar pyrophosphorylase family protein